MSARRVVLLGSTGSIGSSTLDIVRSLPGKFEVLGLSTHRHVSDLVSIARKFRPEVVAISDSSAVEEAKSAFFGTGIKVLEGEEGLYSLLRTLTPRQLRILNLRSGTTGDEPLAQKQVGDIFGLTGSRIGQIENKALKRLKKKGLIQ